jgi:hypothetical protein
LLAQKPRQLPGGWAQALAIMKRIVAILTALVALVLSPHAFAVSYGTTVTKEIKSNIASRNFKTIDIDGIRYLITITTSDTRGQILYLVKDINDDYNVVTQTSLPLYGASHAEYDIKDDILSITYGYAHDGAYETTLKFELSSWSSPPNLDSLLISVTTLVIGPTDSATDESKGKASFFTEISNFNFMTNRLKIWSGACADALQRPPSTKNIGTLACAPTYEVATPNVIKYTLKSINIDDLMKWTGFVIGIVEMNCMKRSGCTSGPIHG